MQSFTSSFTFKMGLSSTYLIPLLLIFAAITVNAKTRRYTFEVSYIRGSPDGVLTNTILGINGEFPGPLIEGELGDIVEITVVNKIQDGQNVTIHWHGIHQRGTPFQDGPSQITQCPIKQGKNQTYSFPLLQPGTYWYHSHVKSQYTEGLWGSFIIRGKPEVHQDKYEDEILITLNDWYQTSAKENEAWFMRPESGGAPPFPFSTLMNGVGRYPCDFARAQRRLCLNILQMRPVFEVKPGKNYRVRLINTSGWVAFNFTIEGHIGQIIEVDGVDTLINDNGGTAHAIHIGAGQRYSFLMKTDQGAAGREFLIRANLRREFLFTIPNANINPNPEVVINEVTGVLKYTENGGRKRSGSPLIRPRMELFDYNRRYTAGQSWNTLSFFNEMSLVPFDRVPPASSFDQEIRLDITFANDALGIRRGSFNGKPFQITQGKPQLAKMIERLAQPETTFPVYIKYGDVIQVVINNPELGPHPLHLHGHHFWVMGHGQAEDGPYIPGRHQLNGTGHRRDTVLVKEKSWLVIRFRADNVGVWTMHCHIDWHNLSGMAMTFVEAPELASSVVIPLEAKRVCADHNVFI